MVGTDIEKEIRLVLTKFKNVEYVLNCIIGNYVSARNYTFFDNVILNSSIMSTGSKINVAQTICKNKNIDKKWMDKFFPRLHELLHLRNLFAHENYYQESSKEYVSGMILMKIDLFMDDNKTYDKVRVEDKLKEFNDLHKEIYEEIKKLNNDLSKS